MKCPVCNEPDLLMSERQGIEIDYCPKCRGVWLDRGELDKLVERSAMAERSAPSPRDHDEKRHRGEDERHRHGHKRKRGGFLSDIFEFD